MKLYVNDVNNLYEQDVEIEVKHEGILEVPEGKNVDDLPMSHFEKLAKKRGLSKITKALNNLQVWNKNDDPKLSKWAGDMIDKLNKKLKKESFRLGESTKPFVTIEDAARYYFDNWYNGFVTNDEIRRNLRRNGYSDDFISDVFEFISELSDDADEYWDDFDESLKESNIHIGWKERTINVDEGCHGRKRKLKKSIKKEAFSTEEYFVGASKEKPMQYDGDNFLYDEIFTFRNDEMGAWEEALKWNMRGYYVTWEKMIDGEVVESKLYRPRELGNKPYI